MATFRSLKHKSLFTPKLSSSTTTKTTPRKSPSKMATYLKGKIFILLLFFSMSIFRNVSSTPETDTSQASPDSNLDTVYGASTQHQQAQIDRLEQLVKNLTELVAKLESHYYDIPRIGKVGESTDFAPEYVKVDGSKSNHRERGLGDGEMESEGFSGDEIREEGKLKSSFTKYSAFWSEQFRFVSAVNLDSIATSLIVLPVLDFEGSSKYVAIGDDRGRVYVFLRNGDILVEFNTSTNSPVTAMISYLSVYKNESVIVTGHSSGAILVHRVWDSSGIDERNSLHMENVAVMDTYPGNRSPISILAVHHVGRSRYILSADTAGKIMVFKENGKIHGLAVPMSRPLAFLKQRLLFLTETGAGSLDLRTMKMREVQCEGLNHSAARSYVFDPTERLKAYGFTSTGDLIHVILLGDATNFKCRVRPWKNINADEPLAFQVIKGYLLIADQEKLSVYNISSHHFARSGAPRLVFSSGIEEITSSFPVKEAMNKDLQKKKRVPLIASDREKLVALGFGGGFVGMYRSNLPIMKGESNSMLWTSPVLFFILFLFGAWHFFAKKKEVLTSWGADDPFTPASLTSTSSAPLGSSGSSDRSYADLSSRNSDSMDLRGNGFSSSRRYGSPTRYPVGGGNSFRPNSIDTSSRPSVEPNFRGASDLKFRGSNIESSGYSNRRENLYGNSHVLDESG